MSNNNLSTADYFKIKKLEEQVKNLREKVDELCYENDDINMRWGQDNERNGDICSEQQEQIIRLEEENKKLKEECGAMDIVEKLNKEFDELQTENQKLVEENDYKTEKNKELELHMEILALYTDFQIEGNIGSLEIIIWFNDYGRPLKDNAVLDEDIFKEFQALCKEWNDDDEHNLPSDKLQNLSYVLESQFDMWYVDNVCPEYLPFKIKI
jgi:predicted nuclease with TOPRIM domain